MAENAQQSEVELDAKQGRVKIRGSDILTTLGISIVVLVGYMVWEHKEDTRQARGEFVGAIKEMTLAQKEGVQAQRTMNCLLATEQKDREAKLSTCERIAR